MKKLNKRLFGIPAMLIALSLGLASCNGGGGNNTNTNTEDTAKGTLVVGYSNFNEKFSPFFSETAYDQDVAQMTQVALNPTDRVGNVVLKSKTGETIAYNGHDYTYNGLSDLTIKENDNGTVYYDFEIRKDVKFSDGVALTIDDVIFSMYVLSDPLYDGSSSFFALPIAGMKEYRNGMSTMWSLILDDQEAQKYTDAYTPAQQTAVLNAWHSNGVAFAQSIADYCMANYASMGAVDVASSAGLWGFDLPEGATAEDFWDAIYDNYGNNPTAIDAEAATETFSDAFFADLTEDLLEVVTFAESANKIDGIVKLSNYKLRVILTEVDATAIYGLPVTVAPLHYYGDKAQYDYRNNKFGFPKGDLSLVKSKTTKPLGAGPYVFKGYDNGVVSFESNPNYYLGAPKTKYVQFKESSDKDKLNGVLTGTTDITDPSFDNNCVASIKAANSNGTLYGDKVVINAVDNLGYGYLGMSAHTVKVGDDGSSAASKNLRKALATIFSVYRDLSVSTYYGDRASVINYPISNTSWAAPQAADDGYEVAFSRDANDNPIYTSGMTADEKYAAAKAAALTFFQAAGYTITDGKLAATQPEGYPLEFEALIPGDGISDHPSFTLLDESRKALADLGFKLIVTDLSNSSVLWDTINADQAEIWCAAWGATVDPDMYQIYFSGDDLNSAGGSNYMYDINDAHLNELILAGRKTTDQAERKIIYKECLDIIIGWAVEVPVYQRQNVIVFSPERVDMNTVTPDITTFYGWMSEIEKLVVYD